MKRYVLIYRLSSMGDVAMVASLLKEASLQNPTLSFLVVSNHLYKDFFTNIKNVVFHSFYPRGKHKGLLGLCRLKKELSKYKIDLIADLHGSIRTKLLNIDSFLLGISKSTIDKGRKAKSKIISSYTTLPPLKPTIERYADVFRELGLEINLAHKLIREERPVPDFYRNLLKSSTICIGISPFAQHPYKVWDLNRWNTIFNHFSGDSYTFIIFGGGKKEQQIAEAWEGKYKNVHSSIGKLTIDSELDLISNLNMMVSMDSAGMHMASLVGIRCLSIWGATHPSLGFLGYGQSLDDCIQVAHPNRPSSVYGNKSCLCDGVEAIDLVGTDMVISRINEVAFQTKS